MHPELVGHFVKELAHVVVQGFEAAVKARPRHHDGADVPDVHGFVAVRAGDVGSLARGKVIGVELYADVVQDGDSSLIPGMLASFVCVGSRERAKTRLPTPYLSALAPPRLTLRPYIRAAAWPCICSRATTACKVLFAQAARQAEWVDKVNITALKNNIRTKISGCYVASCCKGYAGKAAGKSKRPMLVTLAGIVMLARLLQPEKA